MKTAVILFSGGIDSTYVAAKTVADLDKLILITYRVPGMVMIERSLNSSNQLKRLYGPKVEHRLIDIRDFVRATRGGAVKCVKDNIKYKFFYSWCLGCKLSMHLATIDFCKKNNYSLVIDGSNAYDHHALEQRKDALDLFAGIYEKNGIEYKNVFYYEDIAPSNTLTANIMRRFGLLKDSTAHRVEYLRKLGINLGKGFASQYRATQPSCIPSLFFYTFSVPFKIMFKEKTGACGGKCGYLRYLIAKTKS
jgi:hypothetical protein